MCIVAEPQDGPVPPARRHRQGRAQQVSRPRAGQQVITFRDTNILSVVSVCIPYFVFFVYIHISCLPPIPQGAGPVYLDRRLGRGPPLQDQDARVGGCSQTLSSFVLLLFVNDCTNQTTWYVPPPGAQVRGGPARLEL